MIIPKFKVNSIIVFFLLSNILFSQEKNSTSSKSVSVFENIYLKNVRDSNGDTRCATVPYNDALKNLYPEIGTDAEFEKWMSKKISELQYDRLTNPKKSVNVILKIPVVIHIVHNGDALGTGENITDAQAISQITVLNQDYRRMLGTRGYNTHPRGADIEIEFCLAKVDPNGNATSGIIRHQFSSADYTIDNIENNVKPQTIWDPTKYMNMWTVRFGGVDNETLGYAQLPNNSGLAGLNTNNGGATTDGVVASYNAFGTLDLNDGTFLLHPTYKYGRTMTHEVGHFLGLRHIWGDGNTCGQTDYCDDTPYAATENYGCPVINSCNDITYGSTTDPNDMVENYMDYTNDACMNIFTLNQKDRMLVVMLNSPRRKELTTSNVCGGFTLGVVNNPAGTCLPSNGIINLVYTPTVGFSENVLFSATGTPAGSTVTFNPASASSSTTNVQMTISGLSATGTYNISVNGTGSSISATVPVTFKVFNTTPGNVTLQTPTNGSTGVALAPTLTWTAATNVLNYEIQVATTSGFTTIVENKTSSTNSHTIVNTLNPSTTYYWRVRAVNPCGNGNYSGVFSFTTANPTYCNSTYSGVDSEFISKVQFNTINNSSGDALSNGYENFTNISTTINTGTTYNLDVTMNTNGNYLDHCFVFIDWNKDFVFNLTDEKYDLGSKANVTAGVLNKPIIVPTTAKAGSTRMRVIIEYEDATAGVGSGPCTADHLSEWGETEDYTLNVVNNTVGISEYEFGLFKIYPNPSEGLFNIVLESKNTESAFVQLIDMRGRTIHQTVLNIADNSQINASVDYSFVSEGIYLMRISKGNEVGTKQIMIK